MGTSFQALVKGWQFSQVKLFSCCKYPAVPPPTAWPPALGFSLGAVELTPQEKRKMRLVLAFCCRLEDLLELRPHGTAKTVRCRKCSLAYPYPEDLGLAPPAAEGRLRPRLGSCSELAAGIQRGKP